MAITISSHDREANQGDNWAQERISVLEQLVHEKEIYNQRMVDSATGYYYLQEVLQVYQRPIVEGLIKYNEILKQSGPEATKLRNQLQLPELISSASFAYSKPILGSISTQTNPGNDLGIQTDPPIPTRTIETKPKQSKKEFYEALLPPQSTLTTTSTSTTKKPIATPTEESSSFISNNLNDYLPITFEEKLISSTKYNLPNTLTPNIEYLDYLNKIWIVIKFLGNNYYLCKNQNPNGPPHNNYFININDPKKSFEINIELINLILGDGSNDSKARQEYLKLTHGKAANSDYIKACKSSSSFEDYFKPKGAHDKSKDKTDKTETDILKTNILKTNIDKTEIEDQPSDRESLVTKGDRESLVTKGDRESLVTKGDRKNIEPLLKTEEPFPIVEAKGLEGTSGLQGIKPQGLKLDKPGSSAIFLFDTLTKLISAKKAGHNNLDSDIKKLTKKLLDKNYITKDKYDRLIKKYL